MRARSACRARSTSSAGAPPSPPAASFRVRTPSSAANCVGECRRAPRACPPCRWPGSPRSPARNRPLAAGTASRVATACAPALSPKIVTLSGSPPNTAMLSRTHRSAITRSRRNRLSSIVTLARRQRRQVQAAQRAEPVVHRDVHAARARQCGAVIDRRRRAAQDVAAAVDEDHHRQRPSRRRLGRRRRSASGSPRSSAGTCRRRSAVYMRCCGAQLANPWQ